MKRIFVKFTFLFVCVSFINTLQADEKVYKLSMATTWTETTSPLFDAAKNMAKIANTMSNGRLDIKIVAANKHKSPFGVLDMVKGGQYDMAPDFLDKSINQKFKNVNP